MKLSYSIFILFILQSSVAQFSEERFNENMERSKDLVVMIEIKKREAEKVKTKSQSSGIIFGRSSDALLIGSAEHNIDKWLCSTCEIRIFVRTIDYPEGFKADIEKIDAENDFVLLRAKIPTIFKNDLCALQFDFLGDVSLLKRRDKLYGVGYSWGEKWKESLQPEMFDKLEGNIIEFQSFSIDVGHSGGGLINDKGRLVGMLIRNDSSIIAYSLEYFLDRTRNWNYNIQLDYSLSDGLTRLHKAANEGDTDAIVQLLKDCPDIDAIDNFGATALHYAATKENTSGLEILMKVGFDYSAKDFNSELPIHWAINLGNINAVKYLLKLDSAFYTQQEIGHSLILKAIESHQPKLAKYLISQGIYLNSDSGTNHTLFHRAIESCQLDIVKYLIESDADLNIRNEEDLSPLSYSLKAEKYQMAYILLQQESKLSLSENLDSQVLYSTLCRGDLFIAGELLKKEANVDIKDEESSSYTPLIYAITKKDVKRIKLLLEHDADISTENPWVTLLIGVLNIGSTEIAILLIEEGAGCLCPHAFEEISIAIDNCYEDVIIAWLKAGNNPFIRDGDGRPLLYSAFDPYRPKIIKAFSAGGHDVNSQDDQGNSFLHQMFMYYTITAFPRPEGLNPFLRKICNEGADINIKNYNDQKPIDKIQPYESVRKAGIDNLLRDLCGDN